MSRLWNKCLSDLGRGLTRASFINSCTWWHCKGWSSTVIQGCCNTFSQSERKRCSRGINDIFSSGGHKVRLHHHIVDYFPIRACPVMFFTHPYTIFFSNRAQRYRLNTTSWYYLPVINIIRGQILMRRFCTSISWLSWVITLHCLTIFFFNYENQRHHSERLRFGCLTLHHFL